VSSIRCSNATATARLYGTGCVTRCLRHHNNMAAFTTLTDGFTPNAHLAELITACNERRLAARASGAYGLPDAIPSTDPGVFQGDGLTKPLHLLMQEMLEALAPWFVDHRQIGYDDSSATDPIAPFTVATWREAAGLHSSGFRRATAWADPSTDPTFDYGLIQTGDIAGYWIWEDIVKGLRALKWTVAITSTASKRKNIVDTESERGDTFSEAISIGDAAWAAPGWKDVTITFPYLFNPRHIHFEIQGPGLFDTYYINANTERNKLSRDFGMASPVALSATFLARPYRDSTGYFFDLEYYDLENKAENTWYEMETVDVPAGSTAATMTVYSIASPSPTPFADAVIEANKSYGCDSAARVILKWTFSHS
jgi:hypothetical protein